MNLNDLAQRIIQEKQERANINSQIRSIMDEFEGKEMDSTKKDELRKLEDAFDKRNEAILNLERQLERERICGETNREEIFSGAKRNEENKEERAYELFNSYLREGDKAIYDQYRNLQQDNPTQGGYLVAPQKFVNELIKEIDDNLFFRRLAKVLPPLQGAQSLGYPKRISKMSRATRGTELQTPTPDSSLAFGKREFKPSPATAEILVSRTLIRNTPSVDSLIKGEMATAFNEMLEREYMVGTGHNGECLGIFTASNDGIATSRDVSTGNTTSAITLDGLKEAKYSIKEQYQKGLSWIFHRDAIKQIAKIKDNNNQYVWQESVANGEPDRLLGKPVHISEFAPNTFSAGAYVGILGDFKLGYWIVDSLGLEIQVLNELYARSNQVCYIGRLETDGMPVIEECFARVKLATE